MNPDDLAACREVLARKAGGFWVEGSPRTTVRNVMHDCIPIGPPVSQQPHNLKGEAAAWVDEKLEEEVQRGQLIRGSSAWGSPPFPTKEAPAHKRARKRRLVVDYRRVNARVKRSTYYCRKATDVLASCAGSVWYSFLDAVTGFNQIANTRRAMEVLAIVARSGKFLPVCLTFGPVNGPDDFCFVVDRAFGPGRGRKLRYTREWVAYVDDLTIRTGRVIDSQFRTDDEAEAEIKEACKRAPVEVVQPAAAALEALGIDPKGVGSEKEKRKWDEREADHNHPTRRTPTTRTRKSLGFWVLWFVGSFHLGPPVGPVGNHFWGFSFLGQTKGSGSEVLLPQPFSQLETFGLGGAVRPRGCRRAAAGFQPPSGTPAGLRAAEMGWTRNRKGGGKQKQKKPYNEDTHEMCKAMTRAYRHGGHGHAGRLDRGWIRVSESARLFGVSEDWLRRAVRSEENMPKQRVELDPTEEWVHALQGHSSDSGITDPAHVYEECTLRTLQREGYGPFSLLFHGTDLSRVDGITRFGLLAGGGRLNNRLTCHWVVGTEPPKQGQSLKGFRSDSTAVVSTTLQALWNANVRVFHGASGVLLTTDVAPEGIRAILALREGTKDYSLVVASFSSSDGVLRLMGESGTHVDAPEPEPEEEEFGLPEGDTEDSSSDGTPRGPSVAAGAGIIPSGSAETAGSSAPAPVPAEAAAQSPAPAQSSHEPMVVEKEEPVAEEPVEITLPTVAIEAPRILPQDLWCRGGICLLCKGGRTVTDYHCGTVEHVQKMARLMERHGMSATRASPPRDAPVPPLVVSAPVPQPVASAPEPRPVVGEPVPQTVVKTEETGPTESGEAAPAPPAAEAATPAAEVATLPAEAVKAEELTKTGTEVQSELAATGAKEEPAAQEKSKEEPRDPNTPPVAALPSPVPGLPEEGKPLTWRFSNLCAGLDKSRLAIRQRKVEAKRAALEQRRKVRKQKLKDSQLATSKRSKGEAAAGASGAAGPGATAGGPSAAECEQAKKVKREVKSEGRKRPNLPRLVLKPYNCRMVLRENQNLQEVERMARAYAKSVAREGRRHHRKRRRRTRAAEPVELAPAIPDPPALVMPATHPWGSWVCSDSNCGQVNGPQDQYCRCGSSFWDSTEWASDLVKKARRDHQDRKKARQRTVLDMALSAARWTCQRCQESNLLRRWKCYKCSAWRKRERDPDDSSESDSERERRIQELHESVAPRKQRKRGGQRQRLFKGKGKGRKKVCRRCRGTHTKRLKRASSRADRPQPRHVSQRAERPRLVGIQVKFPVPVGVVVSFFRKWRLHLPGKARNKLCHALMGNGLRLAEVCRLLGLLSLVPLALRTEQEAEEVIASASSYAQRTISELEEVSVEAVRTTGRIVVSAVLAVGFAALWFVGRLIANRVMRAGHGNTLPCKLIELKDGEMTWEVKGAKGVHRVWISPSGQPACACRSFLSEGNCGHIEAALECCKDLGISDKKDSKKDQQVAFADQPRAKQRGLAALAALGVDAPISSGPTCFDGMVKKAQKVWGKQRPAAPSTGVTGEVGCFSKAKEAVSRTAQPSLQSKESSAGATAPRQEAAAGVSTPRDERWTDGKIRFLADAATFAACEEAIASMNGQGKVFASLLVRSTWPGEGTERGPRARLPSAPRDRPVTGEWENKSPAPGS